MKAHRTIAIAAVLVASVQWIGHGHVVKAAVTQCRPIAGEIVMPSWHGAAHARVETVHVAADVAIEDRMATTTITVKLITHTRCVPNVELFVPVPRDARVRSFFCGDGQPCSASTLSPAEALATYRTLATTLRDPGLLEFGAAGLIRSGPFCLPADGIVHLTYEQVLPAEGSRIDYALLRSELLSYRVPWTIHFDIRSTDPIAAVYSPSHALRTTRRAPTAMTVDVKQESCSEPGPFMLSYLRRTGVVTTTMWAYPDAEIGGGYFMILAGLPTVDVPCVAPPRREITLVLDRSGSMSGVKLRQAKGAVRQVLGGLGRDELFNLITYNQSIRSFSPVPVSGLAAASRVETFLSGVTADGNTDIHAALATALAQKPTPGFVPIVLLLTDGRPTSGITAEYLIRGLTTQANPYGRQVYTFGVGTDVNAPLLEGIAEDSRGRCTFVLPGEDIEAKVAEVFEGLSDPVLTGPVLTAEGAVFDMLPRTLPDVFDDDPVIVLGRYVRSVPRAFTLGGTYQGQPRRFELRFDGVTPDKHHHFVARLWATRRIAELTARIRDLGINPAQAVARPELKGLVNEIVRLSTRFGVLTEYTAFLAHEDADLTKPEEVVAHATENFTKSAVEVRSGWHGVTQAINRAQMQSQTTSRRRNTFRDGQNRSVETVEVQQLADRTFFRRGSRWIDSRIASDPARQRPTQVVEFGTEAYRQEVELLTKLGWQSVFGLNDEVLLSVKGHTVLIRNEVHKAADRPGKK